MKPPEISRARKSRNGLGALVALGVAMIALGAVPGLAAARPITVDNLGDDAGAALCAEGAPAGECTLRAAIEESNTDVGFDQIQFNGVPRSQLQPQTPLPAITEPVYVSGELEDEGPYEAPSVGITAPAGAPALLVEADNVIIEALALGGGKAGIEVAGGSTGLLARGNWFGLKQDSEPNGSAIAGIILGPDSDGAEIGSKENGAVRRNVFANSEAGIEIIGASNTKILGNYIGVEPDGAGPPTLTLTNGVVVEDGPTSKAEETEVGGALSTAEAATSECDGACNVIATEGGSGVAITGETAGLGHRSRIRGNVFGLGADGVTPEGKSSNGVTVVSSTGCGGGPEVTVGGATPTETNYIVGAQTGIYAEGVENFSAVGNAIGIGADGEPSALPEAAGIAVCAEGVTGTAHVTENRMVLGPDATGIESSWGHADITGNSIVGGEAGIVTNEESEGHGDLIQGNSISGVDRQGIEITNDLNVVIGNTITKADWVGIDLEAYANHNRIGGDGPGEANTIVESGLRGNPEDGAITMFTRRLVRNEFAANTGFGNSGAFIKLRSNPVEGEDANGILPPAIATAQQSSASGTTQPEATVRVYGKASAEPGELGVQLAKVQADAAGNWKATFAKQQVGGLVAATATKDGGTSELTVPVAAAADPEEKEGGGGGTGGGGNSGGGSTGPGPGTTGPPPPPAIAKVAPKVKITSGPKKSTEATTAKFKFKATNVDGAKFECKLDGAKWAGCKSPKTYKKLKAGRHTFQVRATANRLTGAVAKYQFTIKV